MVVVLGVLLVGGCEVIAPGPPVEMRGTGVPSLSPSEVQRLALANIQRDEQALGRVLAPARVIRMTFVDAGAAMDVPRLDGAVGWEPLAAVGTDEPSWIVEAMGTFVCCVPGDPSTIGMHALIVFRDASGEFADRRFLPCWTAPDNEHGPDDLEGTCDPP